MAAKLISKFFKKDVQTDPISNIADCSFECESCTSKFPSSIKIDEGSTLTNSTNPFEAHIVVSTGKKDWQHDATDTDGTIENEVNSWASSQKVVQGNIKVSVSSLPNEDEDFNSFLILPYFIWVKNCPVEKVKEVLSQLFPELLKINDEEKELPKSITNMFKFDIKIVPDINKAYLFLCSHKTRDKRCGVTAPIMKREFDSYLRELDLLRDFGDDRKGGVEVVFINHVGGHKFAANLLIYLKTGEMVWYARTSPANCRPIIDQTVLGGAKVWPDHVRLFQKFNHVNW